MEDYTTCPLCKRGEVVQTMDREIFLVSGCFCGPWQFTEREMVFDQIEAIKDKWLLSAWLRHRFNRSRQPFLISDREGGRLPEPASPSVTEKIDAAVLFLADRSLHFGSKVDVSFPEVAPHLWANGPGEAEALLRHLVEAGLANGALTGTRFILSAEGWKRVDQLRPTGARGPMAFVAMKFGADLAPAYDKGIVPALEGHGYKPYIVNADHFAEKIDDKIIAQIRRAALVIADFTGQRQNVYFETGFAMGLGIPVIWSCRSGELKDLHFDIRQYPCLEWTDPDNLRQLVSDRIGALYPRDRLAL
jgi:hypothetical protein